LVIRRLQIAEKAAHSESTKSRLKGFIDLYGRIDFRDSNQWPRPPRKAPPKKAQPAR
jgi:hypothetical protein